MTDERIVQTLADMNTEQLLQLREMRMSAFEAFKAGAYQGAKAWRMLELAL